MQELLGKVQEELRLRNYSPKTIRAYLACVRDYFGYKKDALSILDVANIRSFLLEKQSKNYSSQTVNLYLNAIKFFTVTSSKPTSRSASNSLSARLSCRWF